VGAPSVGSASAKGSIDVVPAESIERALEEIGLA
jgi:hypothetical protein